MFDLPKLWCPHRDLSQPLLGAWQRWLPAQSKEGLDRRSGNAVFTEAAAILGPHNLGLREVLGEETSPWQKLE